MGERASQLLGAVQHRVWLPRPLPAGPAGAVSPGWPGWRVSVGERLGTSALAALPLSSLPPAPDCSVWPLGLAGPQTFPGTPSILQPRHLCLHVPTEWHHSAQELEMPPTISTGNWFYLFF